ncbi:MAG: hypothetical protein EOM08_02560 [Clostridia bacterium]|nr:hypothetical protein [Clostridia bacterium]
MCDRHDRSGTRTGNDPQCNAVGVRQVISEDNLGSLNDQLVQAALFEQGRAAEAGGDPRIISIYSGKGGVGRTTIAVNLAVSLAAAGRRTALIDLNLSLGDAALLLNINAKDTLAELAQEKRAFTIEDIKSYSMQHASGLSVICAPVSPEFAEYITSKHVEMLLNTMRPYYDYIIVDLPNDMAETTLTALETSDDIFLVARKDISSLRSTKILINVLTTLQQLEKLHLLVNSNRPGVVNLKDFTRILEMPVDAVFSEDIKMTQISQERGIPLVIGFPRTQLATEINRLANSLIDKSVKRSLEQPSDLGAVKSRTRQTRSRKEKPVRQTGKLKKPGKGIFRKGKSEPGEVESK